MAQRHNGVRNLVTSFLGKVCTNVKVEPQLQPLDNEQFSLRSKVTSPEARMDMEAGGFWSRGVTGFFDVRVTQVNFKSSTIFKEQEEEKKRKYQQRVLDVEMGSFTPSVFGTNRGMRADCNCFLKRLAEKLSEKNEEPYNFTITFVFLISSYFVTVTSADVCCSIRNVKSNIPCETVTAVCFLFLPQRDFIDGCRLNASEAGVR